MRRLGLYRHHRVNVYVITIHSYTGIWPACSVDIPTSCGLIGRAPGLGPGDWGFESLQLDPYHEVTRSPSSFTVEGLLAWLRARLAIYLWRGCSREG